MPQLLTVLIIMFIKPTWKSRIELNSKQLELYLLKSILLTNKCFCASFNTKCSLVSKRNHLMAILSSREQKRDYFFWSGRKAVFIDSQSTNCNDCNRISYIYEQFMYQSIFRFWRSIFWYMISDNNFVTRLRCIMGMRPWKYIRFWIRHLNGFVHILKYPQIGVFC